MISLIVTTQGNRNTEFSRLLHSLENQESEDFELVVVDQSSDGIAIEMASASHIKSIGVFVGRQVSLSKARNIGLEHATAEFVGFPDDDCWYPRTLISEVESKFRTDGVDCVTCNCFDPNENRYLSKRQAKRDELVISDFNAVKYIMSIGIFCKRSEELFFDEEFGVGAKWGAGEESDLIFRLLKANQRIKYYRRILVYHPLAKIENNLAKVYQYGRGYGALISHTVGRGQYGCLADYAITLIRSTGAVLFYGLRGKKDTSRYYSSRVKGMKDGYLEAKKNRRVRVG